MGIHEPNFGTDTDFESPGKDYFRIHMRVELKNPKDLIAVRAAMEKVPPDYDAARAILQPIVEKDAKKDPRAVEIVKQVREKPKS